MRHLKKVVMDGSLVQHKTAIGNDNNLCQYFAS